MKQNKNKKPRRKNKTIEPDPQGLQYYDETNLKKKRAKLEKTESNKKASSKTKSKQVCSLTKRGGKFIKHHLTKHSSLEKCFFLVFFIFNSILNISFTMVWTS